MKKITKKINFEKNRIRKIARNKKKRKNKKYNPNKNYFLQPIKSSTAKMLRTKVQKILEKNNFIKKIDIESNKAIIRIPKEFCFIRNPEQTLDVLKRINYFFEKTKIEEIFFDYSECELLGLDASVVTDVIIIDGLKYRKRLNIPVKLNGNYPKTSSAIQVFITSGLLKHLDISSEIEDPLVERLDPFAKNESSLDLTNKVILYYQKCLQRNGYELSPKGIDKFNNLVGEIIDNLGNHCGKNGDWFVSGHFAQRENNELGKGTLTFISFGNTIYESLKEPDVSSRIRKKLEAHTKCHKKLFEIGSWNEEMSWTVFALQYKISRLNSKKAPDRGTGTIKFIQNFSILGKTFESEKPLMTILSGNTHILFDGTYNLKNKIIRNKEVPVIAFNKENDLKKRPDKKAVKLLKNKFPGTIITVEFFVDSRYLKTIKEDKNNEKK